MLSNEMIIVYVLSGINIILLIILLIKAFSKNKLPDVINNNATAQNEKINNLLNYIKQLDNKIAQANNQTIQLQKEIEQIENSITIIEEQTKHIEEETKHVQDAVRKEISLTRMELNNQILRSREKV